MYWVRKYLRLFEAKWKRRSFCMKIRHVGLVLGGGGTITKKYFFLLFTFLTDFIQ